MYCTGTSMACEPTQCSPLHTLPNSLSIGMGDAGNIPAKNLPKRLTHNEGKLGREKEGLAEYTLMN